MMADFGALPLANSGQLNSRNRKPSSAAHTSFDLVTGLAWVRTGSTGFPLFRPGMWNDSMGSAATKTLVQAVIPAAHYQPKGGIIVSSSGRKKRASTKLPGTVEKVIKPHPKSGEPEKAQIAVEGADHLYRELRVPNRLTDEEGHSVKLKEGMEVEVKIESESAEHSESMRSERAESSSS